MYTTSGVGEHVGRRAHRTEKPSSPRLGSRTGSTVLGGRDWRRSKIGRTLVSNRVAISGEITCLFPIESNGATLAPLERKRFGSSPTPTNRPILRSLADTQSRVTQTMMRAAGVCSSHDSGCHFFSREEADPKLVVHEPGES